MSGIDVEQRYKRLNERMNSAGMKDNYQKQRVNNEIINEFLELEKMSTQTLSTEDFNLVQNNINLVSEYIETNYKTLENIQKIMNDKLEHKNTIISQEFEVLKLQERENIISINDKIDNGIDSIAQDYADFSKRKLEGLQKNTLKASKQQSTIELRYREFVDSTNNSAEDLENDISSQLTNQESNIQNEKIIRDNVTSAISDMINNERKRLQFQVNQESEQRASHKKRMTLLFKEICIKLEEFSNS